MSGAWLKQLIELISSNKCATLTIDCLISSMLLCLAMVVIVRLHILVHIMLFAIRRIGCLLLIFSASYCFGSQFSPNLPSSVLSERLIEICLTRVSPPIRELAVLLEHRDRNVRHWAVWALFRSVPIAQRSHIVQLLHERLKVDSSSVVRQSLFKAILLMEDMDIRAFLGLPSLLEQSTDLVGVLKGLVLRGVYEEPVKLIPDQIWNVAYLSSDVARWLWWVKPSLSPPKKVSQVWLDSQNPFYLRVLDGFLSNAERLESYKKNSLAWRHGILYKPRTELSDRELEALIPTLNDPYWLISNWLDSISSLSSLNSVSEQFIFELVKSSPSFALRTKALEHLLRENSPGYAVKLAMQLSNSVEGSNDNFYLSYKLRNLTQAQWNRYLSSKNITRSMVASLASIAVKRGLSGSSFEVGFASRYLNTAQQQVFTDLLIVLANSQSEESNSALINAYKVFRRSRQHYERALVIRALASRPLPKWFYRLAADDEFPEIRNWALSEYLPKFGRILPDFKVKDREVSFNRFQAVYVLKLRQGSIRLRLFPESRFLQNALFRREVAKRAFVGKSIARMKNTNILNLYQPIPRSPWTYRLPQKGHIAVRVVGCPKDCWITAVHILDRDSESDLDLLPIAEVITGLEVLDDGFFASEITSVELERLVRFD